MHWSEKSFALPYCSTLFLLFSCPPPLPYAQWNHRLKLLSDIFPALSADIFSFPVPIPKLFDYSAAAVHSPDPWEFCTKISIPLSPVDWYRPAPTPQGLFLAIQCATAPDLMQSSFPRRQKATHFHRFKVLDPLATLLFILPTSLVSLKGNGWVRERQNTMVLCLHSTRCPAMNCFLVESRTHVPLGSSLYFTFTE